VATNEAPLVDGGLFPLARVPWGFGGGGELAFLGGITAYRPVMIAHLSCSQELCGHFIIYRSYSMLSSNETIKPSGLLTRTLTPIKDSFNMSNNSELDI
jgi:hypothetical protein